MKGGTGAEIEHLGSSCTCQTSRRRDGALTSWDWNTPKEDGHLHPQVPSDGTLKIKSQVCFTPDSHWLPLSPAESNCHGGALVSIVEQERASRHEHKSQFSKHDSMDATKFRPPSKSPPHLGPPDSTSPQTPWPILLPRAPSPEASCAMPTSLAPVPSTPGKKRSRRNGRCLWWTVAVAFVDGAPNGVRQCAGDGARDGESVWHSQASGVVQTRYATNGCEILGGSKHWPIPDVALPSALATCLG